jgi:hypothetical protein
MPRESGPLSPETKDAIRGWLREYFGGARPDAALSVAQRLEVLANVMRLRKDPPYDVARIYMEATWGAEDEGRQGDAQRLRRRALPFLLAAYRRRWTDETDLAEVAYAIGEVHRRLGMFDKALEWYARARIDNKWLRNLCEQQRELAALRDAREVRLPVRGYVRDRRRP